MVSKLNRIIILKAVVITSVNETQGAELFLDKDSVCVDLTADLPLLVSKCGLKSNKEVVQS